MQELMLKPTIFKYDTVKEFVDEFKEACKKLGIKQSDVFRKAMQDMIEKANNI